MATNLALNDDLIDLAMKLSGAKSKKDTVNTALEEYIGMLKRRRLASKLGRGTADFDPDYDYKKTRSSK
jgi:Arc/MetJ family transcription regulator